MNKQRKLLIYTILTTLVLFLIYSTTTILRTELGWWENPYIVMLNDLSLRGLGAIISGVIVWNFIAKMFKKGG